MTQGAPSTQPRFPLQIVVNYWEISPVRIRAYLDEIVRSGLSEVTSFVPWRALESDISHGLLRYLRNAKECGLRVHLIVTPEPGVQVPDSGLPKDLVSRTESWARTTDGQPVMIALAPRVFAVPSLLSSDFQKRYSTYLTRLESVLHEASQNFGLNHVTLDISGSYFKYLRTPVGAAYEGECRDESSAAQLQFRQAVDQFFGRAEFSHRNPILANQWKSRAMESVNAKWFFQSSEDSFRSRTRQMLARRIASVQIQDVDVSTPEADPSLLHSTLLRIATRQGGDFYSLSRLVDASVLHAGSRPLIHWTALGSFHALSTPQRQYLVLKALLAFGSRGGAVLLDESEWRTLSKGFKARVETLGRALQERRLVADERVFYLVPHQWSGGDVLGMELKRALGARLKRVTRFDEVLWKSGRENPSSLSQTVFIDPSYVITAELMQKLVAWLNGSRPEAPRNLVISRSGFMTDAAHEEFERWYASGKSLALHAGLRYELATQNGRAVIFDSLHSDTADREAQKSWETFVQTMLGLADVRRTCQVIDPKLDRIELERGADHQAAVFVMNGSNASVQADLVFPRPAELRDLVSVLRSERQLGGGERSASPSPLPKNQRFTLEVPAYGVLPVAVGFEPKAHPAHDVTTTPHVSQSLPEVSS